MTAASDISDTVESAEGEKSFLALFFCTDLMFAVQLQNIARSAGFRYLTLRPNVLMPAGDVLVVDLASKGDWEAVIREAADQGMPVIAFGPHIESNLRRRARDAGASRVLANSNLARELPTILRTLKEA